MLDVVVVVVVIVVAMSADAVVDGVMSGGVVDALVNGICSTKRMKISDENQKRVESNQSAKIYLSHLPLMWMWWLLLSPLMTVPII